MLSASRKGTHSGNFGRAEFNLQSTFLQLLVALKGEPFIWYTNSICPNVSLINIKPSLALNYLNK